MVKIDEIELRIIKDSRGEDTLEAMMRSGSFEVFSSVPHGKSLGEREAFFVDVSIALQNFEKIKPIILKQEFESLIDFDNFLLKLDGTDNKKNLGGNLTLVLSQAFARLVSSIKGLELWQYLREELFELSPDLKDRLNKVSAPYFLFNLINGGKHAVYGPKIQEYMIVPQVDDPKISLEIAQIFFSGLKAYFKKEYGKNEFGDEGGLLISEDDYEKPLKIFEEIKKELNLQNKIKFSLDIAASSFYDKEKQAYLLEKDKSFSAEGMNQIYKKLISQYDIFSLEDPFEEQNWESFQKLTSEIGEKTIIIGDDLTVTNPELAEKAVKMKAITGVIIKPTQIGTISETLKTIDLANKYKLKVVISHRSAETNDDFIGDLTVASGAWALKAGAPNQEERMVKYNRVIEIIKHKT